MLPIKSEPIPPSITVKNVTAELTSRRTQIYLQLIDYRVVIDEVLIADRIQLTKLLCGD